MRRYWPQLLLISLGVLLVFGQSMAFEFVRWDDDSLIIHNPYVSPFSWERVAGAWARAPAPNVSIATTESVIARTIFDCIAMTIDPPRAS